MSNIDYTKHKDKRKNNPTIENRNFFVKEENAPYAAKYSRDPSLDPQLVWKGKDEQDQEDLAVPTVPIYIQEKILPAAVIGDLVRNSSGSPGGSGARAEQFDLFGDFNGLELEAGEDKFEKEVEFYEHDKNWSNRMILGDSLLVMNSLAEKEGLKGKVQCIYIDPPYGIKFGSNWQVSTRKRDVKDGKAEDAAREPEVVRAFRDTWKLGVHSYLSYLRDRFRVAQELLTETGSIFVQIGDENVHLVRCVLDEVFGSENFVSLISFNKNSGFGANLLPAANDFIIWYAKARERIKFRTIFEEKSAAENSIGRYRNVQDIDGRIRPATAAEREGQLSAGVALVTFSDLTKPGPGSQFALEFDGQQYRPEPRWWGFRPEGFENLKIAQRIAKTGKALAFIRRLDDFPAFPINNVWTDIGGIMSRSDPKVYVVQTSAAAIQNCILMATDPGDLVLDPTCGSGTTAYVAEQWGRRWITIDTSRVALALARTRLMSAKFPYYLLADSPEGIKKEGEVGRITPDPSPPSPASHGGERGSAFDIRKGFVYERVPHVTLKSIANNPDIETINNEYRGRLDEALEEVSKSFGKTLKEWEVPKIKQEDAEND